MAALDGWLASKATQATARQTLLKSAQDPRLKNAISEIYRPDAKIGSGSAMDAYRYESATGQLLSPTGHAKKLVERRAQLTRLLRDPKLSSADRHVTKNLLIDIPKVHWEATR